MLEYIVKVDKKYNLDPQKVLDGCKGHPSLTFSDPDLNIHPAYKGVEGRYHKFLAPTEIAIGVLVQQIQFETSGLVKEILIETQ